MKKIGTHNSMSYLPSKKWYMTPFKFIAKCQRKNIKEQYKLGARMFDIRVSFDKNGIPEFRHGSMVYKGNVEETLETINNLPEKVYVRLILEANKPAKDDKVKEDLFSLFCTKWKNKYTNIRFFAGRRKYDWKLIYDFKRKEPTLIQKISSMTGTVLDDWYPLMYAKVHNKKNIKEHKGNSSKWLLVDFIDIQ